MCWHPVIESMYEHLNYVIVQSGPTAFASAGNIHTEFSDVKPSAAPQRNESSMKMSQNDTPSRTASSSFPETNTKTSTSIPFTQSESRPSGKEIPSFIR